MQFSAVLIGSFMSCDHQLHS